jgi:hypothetical protein
VCRIVSVSLRQEGGVDQRSDQELSLTFARGESPFLAVSS